MATAATAIRVDAEGVVAFTAALVRARTRTVHEAGGANEAPAADLVAAKRREWGWEPGVTEAAPGRPNVIVTVEGGGGAGPTLSFEGHLDVVTEGDRAAWSVDPYGAVVVDGRLYGRGSADMKSGVGAMVYGTRALQLAGPFPGAVRLLALSDEEGMMLGVKHAVASGALDGVAGVIVCEPEGDEVCPSSKGAVRLGIELHGRMAHGAMPDQGRNPRRVLGRLLEALGRMQDDLTSTSPRRRSAATHGSTRKRPVPFSRAPSPILPIRRTGRCGSDSGSAAA